VENELKKYFRIILHRAWLTVVLVVVFGGIAYIVGRTTPPVYSATNTVQVIQAPGGSAIDYYAALASGSKLAATYAQVMTQRPVLQEVIDTLNLDLNPSSLAGDVNVSVSSETQLMRITVESGDPQQAADLANAIPVIFARQNAARQATRYVDSKDNLTKELEVLQTDIDQKQAQLSALGTGDTTNKQGDISRLQTELTQLQQSRAGILQSFVNIRLAETQSTDNITVVEPATVPTAPIRPRIFQNVLLASVFGLMLSLGLIFLIEYLDDRIRTPDQIDQHLGLPVIGLIAKIQLNSRNPIGADSLVAVSQPRSPVTEAFRSLRTNIQFAGVDKQMRILLVTSAGPTEGKSTVAANLAVVMAQAGLRVVLLDGDLRRPTVHKFFEQSDRTGLTDIMLQDPSRWNGVTKSTTVDNLSMILSGPLPPNPSELLGSKRMRQLFDYLLTSSDMIIVDAPPLLPVTDALVLSQMADGVVLVVNIGATRLPEAIQAKTQMDQAGANIIGAVLNMIPTGRGQYSYYYYYHRYYYYDKEHKSGKRRSSKSDGKGQGLRSTLRRAFRRPGSVKQSTAPSGDGQASTPLAETSLGSDNLEREQASTESVTDGSPRNE
jgi:non-specific protein-tyrosine kinase